MPVLVEAVENGNEGFIRRWPEMEMTPKGLEHGMSGDAKHVERGCPRDRVRVLHLILHQIHFCSPSNNYCHC